MKGKKVILDACCGGRMMWYNKKHPNAIYIDIRKTKKGDILTHPGFMVNPVSHLKNLLKMIHFR